MDELAGKVALITGAGRGIGRLAALRLAKRGVHIALVSRSASQLASTAEEITANGGLAIAIPADVASPHSVANLKEAIADRLGHPSILVNAAGVFGPIQLVWKTDPAAWIATVMVNTIGPYLTCQAFVGDMVREGWGRVVNVTSAAALHEPGPINSAYGTSKAALNQFTRHLAAEISGSGVTANVIHPGDVKTDMWADIRDGVEGLGPVAQRYRDWAAWVESTGGDDPAEGQRPDRSADGFAGGGNQRAVSLDKGRPAIAHTKLGRVQTRRSLGDPMNKIPARSVGAAKIRLQAIAGVLQPVSTGVAQSVVNRILDLVRTGMLRSGDRLPSERELIDIFGISRPSLREAIRALSTLGVVETRHGGGAYVTDLEARTLLAPLDFFLSLSQSNLADVFESRRIVEIEIVRKAAINATAEDVETLKGMLVAHEKVLTDPVGFRILDARFHAQLSQIAGNSILERIAYGLYNMGLDIRRRATENVALIRRSLGEHTAIVRAIEAGDTAAAVHAMAFHLDHIEASTRARDRGGRRCIFASRPGA